MPAAQVEAYHKPILFVSYVAVVGCEFFSAIDDLDTVLAIFMEMDAGVAANDVVLPVASEPGSGPGGVEPLERVQGPEGEDGDGRGAAEREAMGKEEEAFILGALCHDDAKHHANDCSGDYENREKQF